MNYTSYIVAPDTVFDLHITPGNKLVACGKNFISSTNLSSPVKISFSKISNPCSSTSATVFLNTCSPDSSLFTYLWSNGATTQTASGLSIGIYTVTISTPRCDFFYTDTININNGIGTLSLNSYGINLRCNGDNSGIVSVSPRNGTSPFSYVWTPMGATTSVVSGLSAGIYTILVTDSCGNIGGDTIVITQPAILTVTSNVIRDENCNGDSIGSATVFVNGGTKPYTYLWNPSNQTSDTAKGLKSGAYSVQIIDMEGCTVSSSVLITQPNAITVGINILSNEKCYGDSSGGAFASASGGSGFYAYLWSSGQTNAIVKGLSAGVYTVTVTDNNGCSGSASVLISQPPLLIDTTSVLNPTCIGQSNGSAFTSAYGGVSPYKYFWSNSSTQASVSGLSAGSYSVKITDANGCSILNSITVNSIPLPHVTLIKQSLDTVCNNAGAILLFGNPSGGFYGGTGVTSNFFYPDSVLTGKYSVFYYTYTDTDGCVATAFDSIYVDVCTKTISLNDFMGIVIYPNPAKNIITIESFGITGESFVSLTDVLGRELYLGSIKENQVFYLPVSGFVPGIYFVTLKTNTGIIFRKKIEIIK